MIQLTRINRSQLILNADLIENIQSSPDTVITLTTGRNYLVLEQPAEIIQRIIEFRREVSTRLPAITPETVLKGY